MSAPALSAFVASATASFVEFVEAMTVVLAVGAVRGWRPAIAGAAAAFVLLALSIAVCGPALLTLPTAPLQVGFGTLLVLFGSRWLRKATRRAAGLIPLRDEAHAFARHRGRLATLPPAGAVRFDLAGAMASFQVALVEGLEVVFVVVAAAAGGSSLLRSAVAGAAAALVLVLAIGAVSHRPIARVPGNTLKRIVGAVLCGFGTFWVGEGLRLGWPGGEWSIPFLVAGYLGTSAAMAAHLRSHVATAR